MEKKNKTGEGLESGIKRGTLDKKDLKVTIEEIDTFEHQKNLPHSQKLEIISFVYELSLIHI